MDDEQAPNRHMAPINIMIFGALCVIIGILLYNNYSASRSDACRSHIGESVFIGTRTAVDARWSLAEGCKVRVRDTSDRVFSHVSSADTKPDDWESETGWNMSLDIERSAREKVANER